MSEDRPSAGMDWLYAVRRIYLEGAPAKLDELERAIAGLEMNPASSTHERRLRRLLHNLIGSGASYGFPAVTDAARCMLECIKQHRVDHSTFTPEAAIELRTRLHQLRRIFDDIQA